MAVQHLGRWCLAAGTLLWPRVLAQPICSVAGDEIHAEAASRSGCGVGSYSDVFSGSRRLVEEGLTQSWQPARNYRAAAGQAGFAESGANALLGSLDEHSPQVSVPLRDLPSKLFEAVVPARVGRFAGKWANTEEGEWMTQPLSVHLFNDPTVMHLLPSSVFRFGLKDAEGNCSLAGVSIYQTAPRTILARLNFDGCGHASGVRHAAVIVPVHESSYGTSRLVDWMCALMPHHTCFGKPIVHTTLAPGHVQVAMGAKYWKLFNDNPGQCNPTAQGRAMAEEHGQVRKHIGDCAQECLTENTRLTFRETGGSKCTGFSHSFTVAPYCIIYMDVEVTSLTPAVTADDETWTCYKIGVVDEESNQKHVPIGGVTPEEQQEAEKETIGLNLNTDLNVRGMAVRRRLKPIAGCGYEPLDWIDLSHASRHPHNARFGAPVTLNSTMFQKLVENLPILDDSSAARVAGGGGTAIGTDSVCVDTNTGLCRPSQLDIWRFVHLLLVAAIFFTAGFFIKDCCKTQQATKRYVHMQIDEIDASGKVVNTIRPGTTQWNNLSSKYLLP